MPPMVGLFLSPLSPTNFCFMYLGICQMNPYILLNCPFFFNQKRILSLFFFLIQLQLSYGYCQLDIYPFSSFSIQCILIFESQIFVSYTKHGFLVQFDSMTLHCLIHLKLMLLIFLSLHWPVYILFMCLSSLLLSFILKIFSVGTLICLFFHFNFYILSGYSRAYVS